MKKVLLRTIALGLMLTIIFPAFASAQGIQGSTQGNLANGGYITEDKDWYYYSESDIWKIRKNGKNKTKLISSLNSGTAMASNLSIVGNYLYYSDLVGAPPNPNKGIYRLDLKTKKETRIIGLDAKEFLIIGNKLYFIGYNNFNNLTKSIYVSDLNGENIKKLTGNITSFTSDGNYLYYQDQNGFYRATLNNKSKVKVSSKQVYKPIIVNKTIYYINNNDNNKLYKMDLNGGYNKSITKISVNSFNYYNGKILYSNKVDYPKTSPIHIMSLDGKNVTTLTNNTFDNIAILGEKIAYATRNKNLNGWADYRLGIIQNGKIKSGGVLFTVKYP